MEEKRGREWTNGRRREGSGRGQTEAFGVEVGRVGGVTAAGQLWCHHDSGEGEEKGWSHTSQEEAAPLVVFMSASAQVHPSACSSWSVFITARSQLLHMWPKPDLKQSFYFRGARSKTFSYQRLE